MSRPQSNDAYKQGGISIVVNTLLFIAKYYAGIVSGSIALVTDAWHTISDSLSSVVLIIGTKMSDKPADHEHPFGHGRAELITAMIIGIMLALIGFNFAVSSVTKLINKEDAQFGTLALVVTIISILANEGLAQYAFYLSRKSKNASIKADGWHHRSDAISSGLILAGILLGKNWWWMDGVLGILMALFIFFASYEILKDVISPLLGEKPNSKLIQQIVGICHDIGGEIIKPHHFHVHQYGYHTELTFHIVMDGDVSLNEAHKIADQIELKIMAELKIEATIHVEPEGDPGTISDLLQERGI
jgi:cation diffusion facilitator family transporter